MQKQIVNHVNTFSLHVCVVTEKASVPNMLLSVLEKWKKPIDNKGFAGGIDRSF